MTRMNLLKQQIYFTGIVLHAWTVHAIELKFIVIYFMTRFVTFDKHVKKKLTTYKKYSTHRIVYLAFGEKIKNCLKNSKRFSKEFRQKQFRTFYQLVM